MTSRYFIKLSGVVLVALVVICIVLGSTGDISMFTQGFYHAVLVLSFGLLLLVLVAFWFVHLVLFTVYHRRRGHLPMVVLIPVTAFAVVSLSHEWQHYQHHKWFFTKALPEYGKAVEKIMEDPYVLQDEERLHLLVDHPAGCPDVHGEMRSDGSIAIFFASGDHWRESYAFFSGGQINVDTNGYLTNGWFEY